MTVDPTLVTDADRRIQISLLTYLHYTILQAADEDGDNSLTLEEYQAYLHPEEFTRMKDVVLDETLGDMDKDGDGMLSMEEYMSKSGS